MTNLESMERCINLDWLECYCLEDNIGFPHNAEYFRRQGLFVRERDYGTPVYHEMFTIYGRDDQPLLEIRRNPKSQIGHQVRGVLDPMACHVRLCNRTCYFSNPARLMQQFLEQYGLHFQRISRVDVCLDFTTFDSGDDPADFMDRYFRRRYSKINQANISAHGSDMWDGRRWNSVSWGSPKSMIGTKFYNKTMELRQKSDKPYIRQAWRAARLVDDEFTLTKTVPGEDGKPIVIQPEVWRIEFSIKSGTRGWFVIEDNNTRKKRKLSVRNTLDVYSNPIKVRELFFSLVHHYFHFKLYVKEQRKDRCPDKMLFRTDPGASIYKLETVATIEKPDATISRLLHMLQDYAETATDREVYKAAMTVCKALEERLRRDSLVHPWPEAELQLIRSLLAKRYTDKTQPLTQDRRELQTLIELTPGAF